MSRRGKHKKKRTLVLKGIRKRKLFNLRGEKQKDMKEKKMQMKLKLKNMTPLRRSGLEIKFAN